LQLLMVARVGIAAPPADRHLAESLADALPAATPAPPSRPARKRRARAAAQV